jgi:hypothetical protein
MYIYQIVTVDVILCVACLNPNPSKETLKPLKKTLRQPFKTNRSLNNPEIQLAQAERRKAVEMKTALDSYKRQTGMHWTGSLHHIKRTVSAKGVQSPRMGL